MLEHCMRAPCVAVRWVIAGCVVATSACARPARPTRPTPPVAATPAPALPAVPLVDGPLAVRVVYPPAGALVQARDSSFIFGTIGSGKASLSINGTPVRV